MFTLFEEFDMFHWDFLTKNPWENQFETSNSGTADPTCQGSQARAPGSVAQPLGGSRIKGSIWKHFLTDVVPEKRALGFLLGI